MKHYNIVADYMIYGQPFTCLVYGGGHDKNETEKTLQRIIHNPTATDKFSLGDGKNVRIETNEETPWWERY